MKEKLFTNQKETTRASKAAVDQANKTKNPPTHCVLCGSIPKPDEWSSQVENCCIDCA